MMNSILRATSLFILSAALVLPGCGSSEETGGGGSGSGPSITELASTDGFKADEPRFSPDGSAIAYNQYKADDSGSELAVMSADGKNRATLAPADGSFAAMAWSPDGKQIFFSSSEGISSVSAAGGTPTVVVKDFAVMDPDVSPDGEQLVYTTNGGNLKLVDLADPANPKDLGEQGSSPRFSPDGKKIAFEASEMIKLYDIASAQVTDVVDAGTYLASVDWFPGGDKLAITSKEGVEIVTLGDTPKRELVMDEFAAMNVEVSPDGKTIAYTVNGPQSIYLLRGF